MFCCFSYLQCENTSKFIEVDLGLKYPAKLQSAFKSIPEMPPLRLHDPISVLGELLCRPHVQDTMVSHKKKKIKNSKQRIQTLNK